MMRNLIEMKAIKDLQHMQPTDSAFFAMSIYHSSYVLSPTRLIISMSVQMRKSNRIFTWSSD